MREIWLGWREPRSEEVAVTAADDGWGRKRRDRRWRREREE